MAIPFNMKLPLGRFEEYFSPPFVSDPTFSTTRRFPDHLPRDNACQPRPAARHGAIAHEETARGRLNCHSSSLAGDDAPSPSRKTAVIHRRMTMNVLASAASLPDPDLLARLDTLAASERQACVELVAIWPCSTTDRPSTRGSASGRCSTTAPPCCASPRTQPAPASPSPAPAGAFRRSSTPRRRRHEPDRHPAPRRQADAENHEAVLSRPCTRPATRSRSSSASWIRFPISAARCGRQRPADRLRQRFAAARRCSPHRALPAGRTRTEAVRATPRPPCTRRRRALPRQVHHRRGRLPKLRRVQALLRREIPSGDPARSSIARSRCSSRRSRRRSSAPPAVRDPDVRSVPGRKRSRGTIAIHLRRSPADRLEARRRPVRIRRTRRPALHATRLPGVPPRPAVRPRRAGDGREHLPPLPPAQRVRGRARLRPARRLEGARVERRIRIVRESTAASPRYPSDMPSYYMSEDLARFGEMGRTNPKLHDLFMKWYARHHGAGRARRAHQEADRARRRLRHPGAVLHRLLRRRPAPTPASRRRR